MSRVLVESELSYEVREPSNLVFSVTAAHTSHQHPERESLDLQPDCGFTEARIGLAENRIVRTQAESGPFSLRYRAAVQLDAKTERPEDLLESLFADLPNDTLPYLNPSRYCPSDLLAEFAQREFGKTDRGHVRVEAICRWVHEHIAYRHGVTDAHSDACDVLIGRAGVCRDFAHVGISLCRALGMPARYVAGYAVGLEPPDFHGFFEVFLAGDWYLFDATRLAPRGGFVRIGTGRDAADCSFATIIGSAELKTIAVSANPIDGDEGGAVDPSTPLSTA
ncbi:MAG: transglutaminase family protein [Myxococcales bacterium]|nr:transglutaminase family protein [Myxococcales bacterium]